MFFDLHALVNLTLFFEQYLSVCVRTECFELEKRVVELMMVSSVRVRSWEMGDLCVRNFTWELFKIGKKGFGNPFFFFLPAAI